MRVELLQYTPNCEKLIAAGAKLCYSNAGIDGLLDNLEKENSDKFLKMLLSLGHESPIEHVTFTFGVEGVSRSLLAQLTRHRIASYTVKSQRYVKEGQFEYIIPPEIEKEPEAKALFLKTMELEQKAYDELTEILQAKHKKAFIAEGLDEKEAEKKAEKKAIEDARYVLPNACSTTLMMTFNARSLYNFFEHRCCERAQWEIRDMANEMLKLVKEVAPTLFEKSGPPCLKRGCPEGKMTCGKALEKRKEYLGTGE
ncbi:MAG: FAD-dependent thymidylate synthase [Clostridia bacterium]|nr:FAD-dependent thymidylate synthase [Clostridia bacterium]